ncbi:MAG: pyruvate, phosphate dikinase, partial [Desulfobacteraceae bacterium]|nr:pyruvate, phosphate dikinase [Desulfobacteraceae bacterium]
SLLMFLQKIIRDSGEAFVRFAPVIEAGFGRINAAGDDTFMVFVKNHHQLNRLAEAMLKTAPAGTDMSACNRVLIRYFERTYAYWEGQPDPWRWFCGQVQDVAQCPALEEIFEGVSLDEIHRWRQDLGAVIDGGDPSKAELTRRLFGLAGYSQIVERYRGLPRRLMTAGQKSGQGQRWKIIFLFHIMNIPGLSMIHEETLRAINRTLSWLIANEPDYRVKRLIRQTFAILKTRTLEFPATALNCVLNMGRGVYQTDDSELVNFFIDAVIDLGFQAPMIGGVGDDWQVKVNNAHILNIRTWLALIERNPKWSPRLISYLIIHLSLCGVFIKDTDLFQRDITGLINSGIAPVFNLVKQLARLFPVYFNDIGAEGRLRDISTQVDELVHRRDPLVHFLRKQSHVESSSRVLDLMEATFRFWETGERPLIEPFVPPNLYAQIDVNGPWVDGLRRILEHLRHSGLGLPRGLLEGVEDHIASLIEAAPDTDPVDRERMRLMVSFYRMLHHKYNTVFSEIESHLAVLRAEAFPDIDKLAAVLQETNPKLKLMGLLAYSEQLKELLLSGQTYEVREDIYKKRHFTIDIPSMYGSYHELKFDALGLTFRIESLANTLLDRLVEELDLSLITKATFFQIYERLKLFDWALKIDGLRSVELERQLHLLAHSLEVKGFTFTQYLDIFKGFAQAVKNIINDYFNNIHEANLNRILSQIPADQLLPKYLPFEGTEDPERLHHRVSEIFFRDQISMSLGLQQLDRFLGRILNTLFHQAEKLPDDRLHLLLNYDPQRVMTSIDHPSARMTGIILLGTKGYNMVQLKGFGLPVPPGFIITTQAFRCRSLIEEYPQAEENFKEQMARHLKGVERITGLHFGAPDKPLLFSVRSGSAISQPGMMDTFLNVGINEEIAAGMAARSGNPWFAWDCYRRFLQCFGMAFGLERDAFDAVISEFKRRLSIPFKRDFSGDHMRKVALTYKNLVQDHGVEIPAAPFDQLVLA